MEQLLSCTQRAVLIGRTAQQFVNYLLAADGAYIGLTGENIDIAE